MWHGSELEEMTPTDPQRVDLAGVLRWQLGWDDSGATPRRSLATGHDPDDGQERVRVDLGQGTVRAALGTRERLFVVLADPGQRGAVLAVDPATGELTEVLGAAWVDIAEHCRPLSAPPADLRSYTRYWLRNWADETGHVVPAYDGMSEGRAELVGAWPAIAVEITFNWDQRPGVRMRRRLALFDELGRHTPPEYSDVHLTEDLATGQVPPASPDLRDGVLDV
jgi:hypothetical protein